MTVPISLSASVTGADDQARPDCGHGDAVSAQRPLDLDTAGEMRRELFIRRHETTQVDDPPDALARGSPAEVVGEEQVHVVETRLGEPGRGLHGVHQVDGRLDALMAPFLE